MTVVTPISWFGLMKATTAVLLALTLGWTALSLLVFQDVLLSQLIAALILLATAVLGPLYYLRFQRLKLQYDEHGFALFIGRKKIASGQWKHFNQVSLYHHGYAVFAVRVYTSDKAFIDIPASDLKLDPQEFRKFVTQKVSARGG